MCRDTRLMNIAIHATRLSKHRFQVAALIAKGSRILSIGINKNKSHPKSINSFTGQCGTIHAELDTILGVERSNLEGATIYVARHLRSGGTGLAKPCKSCMHIIEAVGITRIVYTTNKGYSVERVYGENK